jgi:hypothetical protein
LLADADAIPTDANAEAELSRASLASIRMAKASSSQKTGYSAR